jgi:pimeloyl-ACP methyl ester carboxylesterase
VTIRRPEEFNHNTAKINGIDLHYVVEGSGDPLLLVHGWPGFWWEWYKNIPELAQHFTVICPDMRGYGDTEKPNLEDPSNYEFNRTIDDLAALAEHLGVTNMYLVGHDYSSCIMHKFVRQHPELSRKLILSNPLLPGVELRYLSPAHLPEPWYSQFHQYPMAYKLVGYNRDTIELYFRHFLSHWSSSPDLFTDEEIEVFVDNFLKEGNVRGGMNWYRANLSTTSRPWDVIDRVPVGIPTLVLWGMDDPVVPVVWSDYVSDWYYNYEFKALPKVGHWVACEAPDIFNAEAKRFFGAG